MIYIFIQILDLFEKYSYFLNHEIRRKIYFIIIIVFVKD
jgi:hypothetical protein